MKKKLCIAFAALAAILLTAAGIWAYPCIKAAFILHDADGGSFTYHFSAELSEEQLSEEQKNFLKACAGLLGVDEADCLSWRAEGVFHEGCTKAEIFCEGRPETLTEVYLDKEQQFLNVGMLYGQICGSISGQHPIVGSFLPKWEYGDFISLAQIEEIFQVKISDLLPMQLPEENSRLSVLDGLSLLFKMEREKGASQEPCFKTEINGYQVLLAVGKQEVPRITVSCTDLTGERKAERYEAVLSFEDTDEAEPPQSVVSPEEIEKFREIWSLLKDMKNVI